jgi:hypothetical protein
MVRAGTARAYRWRPLPASDIAYAKATGIARPPALGRRMTVGPSPLRSSPTTPVLPMPVVTS